MCLCVSEEESNRDNDQTIKRLAPRPLFIGTASSHPPASVGRQMELLSNEPVHQRSIDGPISPIRFRGGPCLSLSLSFLFLKWSIRTGRPVQDACPLSAGTGENHPREENRFAYRSVYHLALVAVSRSIDSSVCNTILRCAQRKARNYEACEKGHKTPLATA